MKNTGGETHTALELYETIVTNSDLLQKWNQEMKDFLGQERRPEALLVQY